MSVTLTDRDTNTIELTVGGADSKGLIYGVSGGVPSDYKVAYARHTMPQSPTALSRHNLRLERRILNETSGLRRVLSVDITIAVPNDLTLTADQIDDLVTAAFSYFNSEASTMDFVAGVSRQ